MDTSEDAAVESARIAAAAERNWHEMSLRLSPIIGEEGFRLLFKRGLQLTSAKFPLLSSVQQTAQGRLIDPLFSDLKLALEGAAPVQAGEAGGALIDTFTGLLHTLIGEALTTRLLFECPRPLPRDEDPDAHSQEVSP